jgi:hypothetical protein
MFAFCGANCDCSCAPAAFASAVLMIAARMSITLNFVGCAPAWAIAAGAKLNAASAMKGKIARIFTLNLLVGTFPVTQTAHCSTNAIIPRLQIPATNGAECGEFARLPGYYPCPLRRAEGSLGLPVIFSVFGKLLRQIKGGSDSVELLRLAGACAVRVPASVNGLAGMRYGVNQAWSDDNQQLVVRVVLVMVGRQISGGAKVIGARPSGNRERFLLIDNAREQCGLIFADANGLFHRAIGNNRNAIDAASGKAANFK